MTAHPHAVELLPVADLVAYGRNSRTHSPEQIDQLAASLREYGFTSPVLIDAENGIIAGHGRVEAARKIGLAQVPCIRLAHLSEAQKRAYVIADNAIALNAGWDEAILKAEIRDLDRGGLDLSLLGLTDEFLTDLFEPGQMAKAFDRGALEEVERDAEPEYRNESRFPVTVILDAAEFARWDALKERKGMSDKRLLLHLLEEK